MSSYCFGDRVEFGCIVSAVDGNEVISGNLRSFLEMPAAFERAQHFLRRILCCLNVGLIERIDSETPTRHCRRKLPVKKLRAQIVNVRQLAIDNRMPGSSERL